MAKFPYEVSGGEQQRAAIARALITDPQLILADEPTGALDSKTSDSLLRLFGEINEAGQTILMVTHSVKAASHAKRVLFIKDGEIFHQLYRGELSVTEMYERIADTSPCWRLAVMSVPKFFYPKLALSSIKRHLQLYGPYLCASTTMVSMFYMILFVAENSGCQRCAAAKS